MRKLVISLKFKLVVIWLQDSSTAAAVVLVVLCRFYIVDPT